MSLVEIVQMGKMQGNSKQNERSREAMRNISIGSAGGSRAGSGFEYANRNNLKTAGNQSTRSNYSVRHIFRDEESKMRTSSQVVAPAFIT